MPPLGKGQQQGERFPFGVCVVLGLDSHCRQRHAGASVVQHGQARALCSAWVILVGSSWPSSPLQPPGNETALQLYQASSLNMKLGIGRKFCLCCSKSFAAAILLRYPWEGGKISDFWVYSPVLFFQRTRVLKNAKRLHGPWSSSPKIQVHDWYLMWRLLWKG